MRRIIVYLFLGLLPLLTSCPAPVDPAETSSYEPIFMSRSQLETSVAKKPALPITHPGKLYRYHDYILINEQYKGIHVINNQNPRNPINLAFIQVPGTLDFAVKDDILYADNAVDLVAISLHDINNIYVTNRVREAFPRLNAPDNLSIDYPITDAPTNAIIVGWKPKKKK